MIELEGVRKIFNEGRSNAFAAIDGIDLAIRSGAVTLFTGPSGSGKTTLLTLIGCLARPSEGRIRLDGRPVSGLPERFLTELRRTTFGFIFQRFNLIHGLSVLENVILPAAPLGIPRQQVVRSALEILERLDLTRKADSPVAWLSGGEAQRTAMARALINRPRVLIADEPTANLDSRLAGEFLQIIADLRAEGQTVLISSHDPLVVRAPVVERVVMLRDGRIVESG
ncbi:MAG: ABC transporter ATP-binding protein [Magnetococcales bacterium]|nr:ABC transporter ATP-binding protein [Magnetococcales bacterium]MBF0260350.1 ABC transporter ATP-binding protein [Magnetococcales bacterium]